MKLPDELTRIPQWVIADVTKRPFSPMTKTPVSVTGERSAYATHEEALAARDEQFPHVGFVLTEDLGLTFVDLDTPVNEEQDQRHARIIAAFSGTYMEVSASGKGLHIICRGTAAQSLKRDKVEVYSTARYMICTGVSFPQDEEPAEIVDRQALIDLLVNEGSQSFRDYSSWDYPERYPDDELREKLLMDDKPRELFEGRWHAEYPSQSEADLALLGFICTFTDNDPQAVRVFRSSALGNRSKAYRDGYIKMTLGRVRASQISVSAEAVVPDVPQIELVDVKPAEKPDTFTWPPGLIGEVAFQLHELSPRPVPLIATVGSIGMMSVFAGGYAHHNDGLNLYQVLLASSGLGKDSLRNAPRRFMDQISERIPAVYDFLGPAVLASGQALARTLSQRPVCFSVFNEFGITMQRLTSPKASSTEMTTRQILLDIYGASSPYGSFDGIAYAQRENNIDRIRAPIFSMIGESVPSVFREAITDSAITSGLVPRMIIHEYQGERPRANAVTDTIPKDLLAGVETILMTTISNRQAQKFVQIQWDDDAKRRYKEMDWEVDDKINAAEKEDEITRSLWNRVMQNTKRLSALLAVGKHPTHPQVDMECLEWAINYVMGSHELLLQNVETHQIVSTEMEQLKARIAREVRDYYTSRPYEKTAYKASAPKTLHDAGLISYGYLNQRLTRTREARLVRVNLHIRNPVLAALQDLIDENHVVEIKPHELAQAAPKHLNNGKGLFYKWVN